MNIGGPLPLEEEAVNRIQCRFAVCPTNAAALRALPVIRAISNLVAQPLQSRIPS